jgi:hypothetical protein
VGGHGSALAGLTAGFFVLRFRRRWSCELRADAAECALIRDLATDPTKRELFTRLAVHLGTLALEVERAIAATLTETE